MSVFGKLYYGNNANGERTEEPPKNRFRLFFHIVITEWRSLAKLNLLFILCCLPIITIGAASAAMSYILKKLDEQEYVFLAEEFFKAFRENFKQATFYFLFYGVSLTGMILLLNHLDAFLMDAPILAVPMGLLMIACTLVVFAGFYGFCMIGTMELRWKDMFRNSLLLAILGLKANAMIVLFMVPLMLLCYWLFPYSSLFLIPFGASFTGLIIVHNVFPVMKSKIINESGGK